MKFVVIETPRAHASPKEILFALACILDCKERNEIPIMSGWSESNNPIREIVDGTIIYRDLGYDNNMLQGIDDAIALQWERRHIIEYRELGEAWTQVIMMNEALDSW